MENHREFTRIELFFDGALICNSKKIFGKIKDLSLKGMFFITDTDIPKDSKVEINIYLQNEIPKIILELKGKIIRSVNDGLAVYFEEMGIDTFMHLKNIVSYNAGDFDKVSNEFKDFIAKKI